MAVVEGVDYKMALPAAVALSGLPREHFQEEGLEELFNQGAVLLRTSSQSSITSSATTSSYYSVESGISSMSSDSITVAALGFLSSLYEMQTNDTLTLDLSETTPAATTVNNATIGNPTTPPSLTFLENNLRIFYSGRNILNLAGNISDPWQCQTAVIKPGVENFLNNRSQLSRVDGQDMPMHKILQCNYQDCQFKEPQFN